MEDGSITGESFSAALESAETSEPTVAETTDHPVAVADDAESSTDTTAIESAPETDPQATTPVVPEKVERKGPVPFEVHETTLRNARTKERAEVEAEFGWTKDVAPQHRDTVGQFYQLLDKAPTQAVEVLIRQIANDETHAPALRSLLGKLMGTPRAQPAQPEADASGVLEPDVYGTDEQGQKIPLFSAASIPKLLAQVRAQVTAEVQQQYAPLQKDYQSRQQREVQARQEQESISYANHAYSEAVKLPQFKAYEQEIAAAMTSNPDLTIDRAYIQVVVPKMDAQARKDVVASLHDKAASAATPVGSASGKRVRAATMAEAFASLPESALAGLR